MPSVTQANHQLICLDAKRSTLPRVFCKNGMEKFICEICYKTFKYMHVLIKHELKHIEPGGFLCTEQLCDEIFTNAIELKWHEEISHKVSI